MFRINTTAAATMLYPEFFLMFKTRMYKKVFRIFAGIHVQTKIFFT